MDNKDRQRWKITETDEGLWFSPVGSGGKVGSHGKPDFHQELEDCRTWLKPP